eukprot:4790133-Amphidinium_carterae.1
MGTNAAGEGGSTAAGEGVHQMGATSGSPKPFGGALQDNGPLATGAPDQGLGELALMCLNSFARATSLSESSRRPKFL